MKTFNDLKNDYYGKKVLITGHTGFKGSWLSVVLKSLGAEVIGISIDCKTDRGPYISCDMKRHLLKDLRLDICNKDLIKDLITSAKPDFIFHLAAQALVSTSYVDPVQTILTNSIGTLNILDSIKYLSTKTVVVIVTSDKCYENVETFYGYKETDALGGKDPYSASKACAEIISNCYIRSILNKNENINIATARAGNVIGGGDWSKDRLIPDAVNHWEKNMILKLRNPDSTRPWQHVLEPISGYLELGAYLNNNYINNQELGGNSFNFGPKQIDTISVANVIKIFSKYWDNSKYEIGNETLFQEAGLLNLCCDKSTRILGWEPRLRINDALLITSQWYKEQLINSDMFDFTVKQSLNYLSL